MKKFLILALFSALSATLQARDFSFTIRRGTVIERPVVAPDRATDGSLQNAARVGNPLQAINPFAPSEYGSGAPYVKHAPRTSFPGGVDANGEPRPVAVQLVAIPF